MEVYLRLGLLLIAVLVICIILVEAWYRRRESKIVSSQNHVSLPSVFTHPDEILGLDECQDKILNPASFNTVTRDMDEPVLGDLATEHFTRDQEEELTEVTLLENHEDSEVDSVRYDDNDLLVMTVLARPGDQFASYDLLQAISSTGMQFGDMNIFHYYAPTATGRVTLFSLVSATEPGEFDMDHIGDFTCVGLTLFMNLRQVPDPHDAFELMLQTAEQLAEDLDGELRAGHRTPWTQETIEQFQKKVLRYQTLKHA